MKRLGFRRYPTSSQMGIMPETASDRPAVAPAFIAEGVGSATFPMGSAYPRRRPSASPSGLPAGVWAEAADARQTMPMARPTENEARIMRRPPMKETTWYGFEANGLVPSDR